MEDQQKVQHKAQHKLQPTIEPAEELPAEHIQKRSALTYILVGMVVVLVIFSVVQTFQINTLEEKVLGGSVVSTVSPRSSAPVASPAASRSAPAMVGGC